LFKFIPESGGTSLAGIKIPILRIDHAYLRAGVDIGIITEQLASVGFSEM